MIPIYLQRSPLPFVEDLATVPRSAVELAIKGATKNLHLLREWPAIDRLWVYGVNQREWDGIAPFVNPHMLMVYEMRVADLSLVGKMKNLRELALEWNTKAQSLSGLEPLQNLSTLAIRDFPTVTSLEPLAGLAAVTVLDLQGGMWKPLKVATLRPLGALAALEHLVLVNLKVVDASLEPLCELRRLRKLTLSNQFPTQEYARLSVCLPDVECSMLAAYTHLRSPIGGKDVMVVGNGKPFLNSEQDAGELEKYRAQFERYQAAYRAEQGAAADAAKPRA